MQYLRHTFTLPASVSVSKMKWDSIFLSEEEFEKKYGITISKYNAEMLEIEEE